MVTVGVVRQPNNPVPGVRTPNLLRQIAFNWKNVVDRIEEVGTKESFERSMDLCRAGIVVGPSSGFALQGLLQFIGKQKENGLLNTLRNANGEVIAVFICPDGPFPYLNEYFEYLDDLHFPKIENEKLLINKPGGEKTKKQDRSVMPAVFEIDPLRAYEMAYAVPSKEAWIQLKESGDVVLRKGALIVDLRPYNEFAHFHLSGSERMDPHSITENLPRLSRKWKGKKVLVVCSMGIRSKVITEFLKEKGVDAYSIKGGATEWSALNLPRWRPNICNIQDGEIQI